MNAEWDAASVVIVIGALGGMLVTVIGSVFAGIMAWQAKSNSVENGRKSDTIIEKAVEIHTLTNSNLSKVSANLAVALEEIKGLQTLVHEMAGAKEAAALAGRNSRSDIATALEIEPRRAVEHSKPTDTPLQVEVVNQPLTVVTPAEDD